MNTSAATRLKTRENKKTLSLDIDRKHFMFRFLQVIKISHYRKLIHIRLTAWGKHETKDTPLCFQNAAANIVPWQTQTRTCSLKHLRHTT